MVFRLSSQPPAGFLVVELLKGIFRVRAGPMKPRGPGKSRKAAARRFRA